MRPGLFDFGGYEEIVSFLKRVLGRKEYDIQSTLFGEALKTGTTVQAAAEEFGLTPHVYNEDMRRFYEATDAFVFELLVVHMRDACKEIDRRVIDSVDKFAEGSRVLCLGDGIGTDTLRFAQAGFDVAYFEFEGPSSDVARNRFARSEIEGSIQSIHELGNIPHRSYDVVINRVVLEHVPDPPGVIENIWKYLDEDGVAVITESFSRVEDRFPTHLASNQKYAGRTTQLFVEEGFHLLKSFPEERPLVFRKTKRSDATRYDSLPPEYPFRNFIRRAARTIVDSIPA
jgi:2-polyprenyl-3-methyl-5-hydroxy-6-metoxy-1,4-benzoquinol methylase